MITFESNKVENIKSGTLVKRKADAKKTFIRGDYNRYDKKYELQDYDDINNYINVKKGTVLFLDWDTSNEE